MKGLKLAPTISTPEVDEVPHQSSVLDALERRKSANIVEGFSIQQNIDTQFSHKFSSEVNVDNDKLWDVIKAIIIQMPEVLALIYHHIDGDTKYGEYLDKFELLNFLELYKLELCQDGYLEFGIIHSGDDFLEEVFVKKAKYLQYWGMDEERFKMIMAGFELYPVKNLNFIDEYPLKTEALSYHHSDIVETEKLIEIFEGKFGNEQII